MSAARSIGVATDTLLKWMKQPEFDAAYREARRLAFRQSVARLQQASGAAVSTLLKIMVDQNAPRSTRVRAADSVLDHAAKAIAGNRGGGRSYAALSTSTRFGFHFDGLARQPFGI